MNDSWVAIVQHYTRFGLDDGGRDVVAREGANRVERLPDRMCRQFDEAAVIAIMIST